MKKTLSLLLALVMCLSLCACGVGNVQVMYPSSSGEKIEFEDVVLAEDENVKITLVEFYEDTLLKAQNSDSAKCVTFKVENKTDSDMDFYVTPYLNNERYEAAYVSGNTVEAGRIGSVGISVTYGHNHSDVESLEELYNLELTFELTTGSGTNNYNNYKIQCSIQDALNGTANVETAAPEAAVNQAYADVIQLMTNGIWFFNGGSDAALNMLSFTEDAAVITQFVYDGNGQHTNGVSNFSYLMSDTDITVTLADGSELVIPYTVDGDIFNLGNGDYLTPAEVDADLQGYWGLRKADNSNEFIYYYDNGTVIYKKASKAQGGSDGEYYYYGPYEGTYTIDENGLTATARNSWQFGFNVIDGKAVMVRCGDVCSPVSGFKGQYGYSF